jgi:general stress protein YciG
MAAKTAEGTSKMKATMIAKFKLPGMTDEEAEIAYKAYMRGIAKKGGKLGRGNEFAHGKVNPAHAGKKGSKKRWQK